jgi:hypothetical protein
LKDGTDSIAVTSVSPTPRNVELSVQQTPAAFIIQALAHNCYNPPRKRLEQYRGCQRPAKCRPRKRFAVARVLARFPFQTDVRHDQAQSFAAA